MDEKIEKFKSDYTAIKAKVKLIKQKLRAIKKEIKPVAKAAYRLYKHGDKTMYNEEKDRIITPKFNGLDRMMEDLEFWMGLDDVQYVIECAV